MKSLTFLRPSILKLMLLGLICALLLTGCEKRPQFAVIETEYGTIKFELLWNESPATAENFQLLAQRGYYDGTIFHRVISGFMIQGGDPNGNGTGGQAATAAGLPNEVRPTAELYQNGYQRGLVAMANRGKPETAGSQFFIMHQKYPLKTDYVIFGRVVEGMEVVDKIASDPTNPSNNRPLKPITMTKVYVQ